MELIRYITQDWTHFIQAAVLIILLSVGASDVLRAIFKKSYYTEYEED